MPSPGRPQHALQALAIGTGAAMLLSFVPRRVAAGFGLIALTALVMLVAQAPADPYFAQSLQGWEQGRFIRFHGAAQWVGWLWPYAGPDLPPGSAGCARAAPVRAQWRPCAR